MKETVLHLLIIVGLLFAAPGLAIAQSQALNGQIEGTVLDQHHAAVAHATITVTNIETGATRNLTTDESGVYRFPLLPLGTYRITVEVANFKRLDRDGVTLTTGQILRVRETADEVVERIVDFRRRVFRSDASPVSDDEPVSD